MSQFRDRFTKHAIHKTFDAVSTLVDELDFHDKPQQQEVIDHVRRVVDYGRDRLKTADAELVSATSLNQVKNQADAVKAAVEKLDGGEGKLNEVIATTDAMLDSMRTLPQLDPGSEASHYSKAFEDYQKRVDDAVDRIEKDATEANQRATEQQDKLTTQIGQLSKRLTQIEQTINEQKGRLDAAISEYQTQFSTAQEARNTSFNDTFQKQQARFNDATTKHAEEITALLTESKKQINDLLEQQKQSLKITLDDATTAITEHITNFENKQKQASDLVQVIGNIGVTGNYNKIVKKERTAANIFRGMAIFFMVAMVFGVGWIVYNVTDIGWDVALFRIATALIAGIPAWYCAGESSKHRKVEQLNRKLELELASLLPFLETLDEDVRKKTIEALAPNTTAQGRVNGVRHLMRQTLRM